MKTLNLHVDYIEWIGLKKALKNMEDLPSEEISRKRVEEALVVLTAIEKGDGSEVFEEYLESIKDESIKEISKQIGTKKIVLYPYAHLSKNLGSPQNAIKILKNADEKLSEEGYEIYRAPFGYYKSFELKVKGHPLSELSKKRKSCGRRFDRYRERKIFKNFRKK